MNDSYMVLNTLLRTEKGVAQAGANKYSFSVRKNANKIQIKKAVEEIYKVKVLDVNTQVVPGKSKRVRYQVGMTPEWKKAIVTLKDGQKIELS
jgi:large subunit ribosomal protein L23